MGPFLPPAALAAELSRRSKLLDEATEQHEVRGPRWRCGEQARVRLRAITARRAHPAVPSMSQKAVEALVRAQARLDHSRNGAAAKAAAAAAAAAKRSDVDTELQVRLHKP